MWEELPVEEDHLDDGFETFERADEVCPRGPGTAGVDVEDLEFCQYGNVNGKGEIEEMEGKRT